MFRVWHKEPGFITYICARCGAKGFAHEEGSKTQPRRCPVAAETTPAGVIVYTEIDAGAETELKQRVESARQIWRGSVPLKGTRGWRYFVEHRQLDLAKVGDLDLRVLRWHHGIRAVVALMTDAITGEPTGVHRTFLNPDGTKRERKMLARKGVIRLTPDEDVTMGLSITEGIETGLAVLASGWAPVWAAGDAGGIGKFPVLSGVEALTIWADTDESTTGIEAARKCADRWLSDCREVRISAPKELQQHG